MSICSRCGMFTDVYGYDMDCSCELLGTMDMQPFEQIDWSCPNCGEVDDHDLNGEANGQVRCRVCDCDFCPREG